MSAMDTATRTAARATLWGRVGSQPRGMLEKNQIRTATGTSTMACARPARAAL
jgi:hypothetical protein